MMMVMMELVVRIVQRVYVKIEIVAQQANACGSRGTGRGRGRIEFVVPINAAHVHLVGLGEVVIRSCVQS